MSEDETPVEPPPDFVLPLCFFVLMVHWRKSSKLCDGYILSVTSLAAFFQ